MLWNDPYMYGMNFPYKEFTPTQPMTPFLGQFYPYQNIPKMVPTYFGTLPQFGMPSIPFDPFVTRGIHRDPFVCNQIPTMPIGQVPFGQVPIGQVPFGQNLPLYNWYRPF